MSDKGSRDPELDWGSRTRSERMPLTAGTTLGPYEIVAPFGAGSIGEVNQARDTTLEDHPN